MGKVSPDVEVRILQAAIRRQEQDRLSVFQLGSAISRCIVHGVFGWLVGRRRRVDVLGGQLLVLPDNSDGICGVDPYLVRVVSETDEQS